MQESHDHLMAPKCHSRLTLGIRKAATYNKTCDFGATHVHTIEYDSLLSQKSIAGEIVSLILCVEAGFFSNRVTVVSRK